MPTTTTKARKTKRPSLAAAAADHSPTHASPLTTSTLRIPVEVIHPHPDNPRKQFDPEQLQKLADSMRRVDVLQPILVRPMGPAEMVQGAPGHYQLVCGERRWRAARLAGLETIPAVVRQLTHAEALEVMIVENEEREDLNPIELALGLSILTKPEDAGGAGLTHAAAAARFGHEEAWATNLMRLLTLPKQWQERVASGELPQTFARTLVSYARSIVVLDWLEDHYFGKDAAGNLAEETRDEFQLVLDDAVADATRPMDPKDKPYYDWQLSGGRDFGRLFKVTKEIEAQLAVCPLPVRLGRNYNAKREVLPRATNVALYDKLQAEAKKARLELKQAKAKGAKAAEPEEKHEPTAEELRRRREDQDRSLAVRVEAWAEDLMRMAVAREIKHSEWHWLARVFLRHWTRNEGHNYRAGANQSEGDALSSLAAKSAGDEWATLLAWVGSERDDPIDDCDRLDVEEARLVLDVTRENRYHVRRDVVWDLAATVGANLTDEWKAASGERLRDFFNLHTLDQLRDLAHELGEVTGGGKKSEVVEKLAETHEGKPLNVPKVLKAAQPNTRRRKPR